MWGLSTGGKKISSILRRMGDRKRFYCLKGLSMSDVEDIEVSDGGEAQTEDNPTNHPTMYKYSALDRLVDLLA